MNFTTVLTTKNQLTLPKSVRDRLGLKKGTKIDIYPTLDGGFIGRPREKTNILRFAGDLAYLDNGQPLKQIKEAAEKKAVEGWVADKRPYDKNHRR